MAKKKTKAVAPASSATPEQREKTKTLRAGLGARWRHLQQERRVTQPPSDPYIVNVSELEGDAV